MPLESMYKLFDDIAPFKPHLHILGEGDPLLHPKIMDILKKGKEKGFYLELLTSFRYLTDTRIKELINIGVDFMLINLSSYDQESHEKIRPTMGPKGFVKIMKHILRMQHFKRKANKLKPGFALKNVVNKYNIEGLEKMILLGKKLGAEFVELCAMTYIDNGPVELWLDPDKPEVKNRIREAIAFAKLHKVKLVVYGYNLSQGFEKMSECSRTGIVRTNGDVRFCCEINDVIGNINKQSYVGMLSEEKMREILQRNMKSVCKGCPFV